MSSPSSQTVRRVILTASVAAVTATGAWYGAGLKTRKELNQAKQVILEASPAEKIERLEGARDRLVRQKAELQTKIDRFREKAAGGNSTSQTLTRRD